MRMRSDRLWVLARPFFLILLSISTTYCSNNSPEVPVTINIYTSTPNAVQSEPSSTFLLITPLPGSSLEVELNPEIILCSCDGKAKKVAIALVVKNGALPYSINENIINSAEARFEVTPGDKLTLIIKSSDGLIWEGEIRIPNSCEPPPSCDNNGDGGSATNPAQPFITQTSTSQSPTQQPTSQSPTQQPTSQSPTQQPTSQSPTQQPTSQSPTQQPTSQPPPTQQPTACPTKPGKEGRPDCK